MLGSFKCQLVNHNEQQVIGMCENRSCQQIYRRVCLDCILLHQKEDNFDTNDIKTEKMLEEIIIAFRSQNQDLKNNILLLCQIQKYILNLELLDFMQYWNERLQQLDQIESQLQEFNANYWNQITLKNYLESCSKLGLFDCLDQIQEKLIEIDKKKNDYLGNMVIGNFQIKKSQETQSNQENPFVLSVIEYLNNNNKELIDFIKMNEIFEKKQQSSFSDSLYEILTQEGMLLDLTNLKEQARKYFPSKIDLVDSQSGKSNPLQKQLQCEQKLNLQPQSEKFLIQSDVKDTQSLVMINQNFKVEQKPEIQTGDIQFNQDVLELFQQNKQQEPKNAEVQTTQEPTNYLSFIQLALGQLFAGLNNQLEASSMFNQVQILNPQYYQTLVEKGQNILNLGGSLIQFNQYYEALRVLNEAIQIQPNRSEAYNQKGILYEKMQKESEALLQYEEAIKHNPYNKLYQENKGFKIFINRIAQLLEKLEMYVEAIIQYEQLIKILPLNSVYYVNKGKIHQKLGQMDESIISLKQAVQLDRTNDDLYFKLGFKVFFNYKGLLMINRTNSMKPQECSIKLQNLTIKIQYIIELKVFYFHNLQGQILFENNQFLEALDVLDRAIQLDPESSEAFYFKGQCFHSLEEFEDAVEMFNNAIDINPDEADYYFKKALCLVELNDYQDAKKAYNMCLKLDPNNLQVYNLKGLLFQQMGNYQAAIQMFDIAINLNQNDPIPFFNKGQALKEIGKQKFLPNRGLLICCRDVQLGDQIRSNRP
ncbi:hypothetical protein pb186bvf_002155 [Paramecium bursaria]